MHADARGPEPTGGGAASRSQEDAQENIGESGGPSLIQRGGQDRSPGQSLGGQAKRTYNFVPPWCDCDRVATANVPGGRRSIQAAGPRTTGGFRQVQLRGRKRK